MALRLFHKGPCGTLGANLPRPFRRVLKWRMGMKMTGNRTTGPQILAAIMLVTGIALSGCSAKGPSPQQVAAEQADQAAERAEAAADKAEAIFKKNVQK